MSNNETRYLDAASPVRSGEELDVDRLKIYLAEQLGHPVEDVAIEQFPQGFSNLTYLVRCGSDEYVLRRPPFGNQVKSAHDMGREYNVLSKLSRVYELAPKPVVYCTDESVLGASFYLMERRRGVILRRKLPQGFAPDLPRPFESSVWHLSTTLRDCTLSTIRPRDLASWASRKVMSNGK